jgi:hypothetical protein
LSWEAGCLLRLAQKQKAGKKSIDRKFWLCYFNLLIAALVPRGFLLSGEPEHDP